jgi:hypothetical protein
VVLVTLETLPNITNALLLVAVVTDGICDMVCEEAVYQLKGNDASAKLSNGVVLFTPENATIAPVEAVEPEVTAKV